MHAKSVVVDGIVACVGSLNLTHNAYDHSKEYLFEIREPNVVADLVQDFEDLWSVSQEVTLLRFNTIKERNRRNRGSGDEDEIDVGSES